jgi:hypothetical protein
MEPPFGKGGLELVLDSPEVPAHLGCHAGQLPGQVQRPLQFGEGLVDLPRVLGIRSKVAHLLSPASAPAELVVRAVAAAVAAAELRGDKTLARQSFTVVAG